MHKKREIKKINRKITSGILWVCGFSHRYLMFIELIGQVAYFDRLLSDFMAGNSTTQYIIIDRRIFVLSV